MLRRPPDVQPGDDPCHADGAGGRPPGPRQHRTQPLDGSKLSWSSRWMRRSSSASIRCSIRPSPKCASTRARPARPKACAMVGFARSVSSASASAHRIAGWHQQTCFTVDHHLRAFRRRLWQPPADRSPWLPGWSSRSRQSRRLARRGPSGRARGRRPPARPQSGYGRRSRGLSPRARSLASSLPRPTRRRRASGQRTARRANACTSVAWSFSAWRRAVQPITGGVFPGLVRRA